MVRLTTEVIGALEVEPRSAELLLVRQRATAAVKQELGADPEGASESAAHRGLCPYQRRAVLEAPRLRYVERCRQVAVGGPEVQVSIVCGHVSHAQGLYLVHRHARIRQIARRPA